MSLYGIRSQEEVQEILAIASRFKEIELIRSRARARYNLRQERAAQKRTKPQPSLAQRLQAYKAKKREDERKQRRREAKAVRIAEWSLEQQRRSRVDWREIVPSDVAKSQDEWERRQTVAALREKCMTYAAIGALFGCSQETIRQKVEKAKRERLFGRRSPVERWMDAPISTDRREARRLLQQVSQLPVEGAVRRDWLYV